MNGRMNTSFWGHPWGWKGEGAESETLLPSLLGLMEAALDRSQ